MNKPIVLALGILLGSTPLFGQKNPLPFFFAYQNGKAYILVADAPPKMKGFNMYRKRDGEFQLLNEEPIEPERDPFAFRDVLGDEYNRIRNAVRADNELQVMRRVQSDRGSAFAFSLASPHVARALGRLFVDSAAQEDREYTYRIAYVDYRNKEFDRKDRTVRTEEITPEPPPAVKAEVGDGMVKLTWQYPSYAGDPDDIVVGFNIYRQEQNASPIKVNSVLVLRQEGLLSRIDDGLENGMSYVYIVRAVDFIGRESEPSKSAAAMPKDLIAPSVPVGLVASAEEGRIIIDWKMGLEPDISYYDIHRGRSSQGEFSKINLRPISATSPTFVDTNVVFGSYYFYRVKAIDRSGNESKFSAAIPARPGDNAAPVAPADVTSSVKGGEVTLRWRPTQSKDAMGYYVYRGQQPGNLLRMVSASLPRDSVSFKDRGYNNRGLNPGATYYYAVSSIDSASNESSRSTVAVKVPDNEPPAPPFNVRANTDKRGVINVAWQPSPSSDVREFRVYRSQERLPRQRVASVRDFVWRDSAVVLGQQYEYEVSAVDSFGNEGALSRTAGVLSSSVYLPPAPAGVQATATAAGVALTWEPVDPRELLGYDVYRSSQPSGAFEKLNQEIITPAAYADRSGKAGMYYRVVSVSTSGHENTGGAPVRAVEKK